MTYTKFLTWFDPDLTGFDPQLTPSGLPVTNSDFSFLLRITLHTKQSFQSNKTLRKLCGVLATYQGLFFQKTSKKDFKSDLGGTTKRKLYKKTKSFISTQKEIQTLLVPWIT